MSFFSEERLAELRELFFESAQELLQSLNDAALAMEQRPGDAEALREARRTVHTLKGDSAAVGYRELSELAHELEEVLTPEAAAGPAVAEAVLATADVFDAMMQAYRGHTQPPSTEGLRQQIRKLTAGRAGAEHTAWPPQFAWSESEQLAMVEAASQGPVYNVALEVDPQSPVRSAAVQLIRAALRGCGTVLALRPEDGAAVDEIAVVEAAVAGARDQAWLEHKLRIPAAVGRLAVEKYALPHAPAQEMAEDEEEDERVPVAEELAAVPVPRFTPAEASRGVPRANPTRDNILRVDAERIDNVLNLVGELIIGKSMLAQGIGEVGKRFARDPMHTRLADAMAYQTRVLNDLQQSVMKIRMVPVEQLFRRFPRVVRDLAKSCGKQARLVITGGQTDLDKSVLDLLGEPLTHLVRNAVDHGLENPGERIAAGKSAEGTVRLNAYHQGQHVVIEVSDDGRGIDHRRVAARAVERGILPAAEAERLSESERLDLIFRPGFSTADRVTEISGRGVGMEIVRAVLERMKGSVSVETTPGQGTRFLLKVPLTLAIIKALLFRAGERLYAVPLTAVVEIARSDEAEFHHVEAAEIMKLRDQALPVVRLDRSPSKLATSQRKVFVIVVAVSERRFGLVVDRMIGEEELVIKALDDPLVASDLVSGASILGDGTVVLVLDVSAVVARLGRMRPAGVLA